MRILRRIEEEQQNKDREIAAIACRRRGALQLRETRAISIALRGWGPSVAAAAAAISRPPATAQHSHTTTTPTDDDAARRRMRGSTAGLAVGGGALDGGGGASSAHRALLAALDACVSSALVAPAVVAYWRGTWNLADLLLRPDDPLASALASTLLGLFGVVPLVLWQGAIARALHPDRGRLRYYAASRLYTYAYGAVCVNHWRGCWLLLGQLVGKGAAGGAAVTAVCAVALAALRCLRNVAGPPFALGLDRPDEYFVVPTMFRMSSTKEPLLYLLDCLFSVVVVGSLVVFVWRGVWEMIDELLFTSNRALSCWTSLGIGYGLTAVTFLLQNAAKRTCAKLHGAKRLIVADLFLLLSFVSTINVWRSIWGLLDLYFLPDQPALSNWLTHGVSFALLVLMNCSNSVIVRGVYIDAEEDGGRCVVFPCYYLRLFFRRERVKKRRRLMLLHQQQQHEEQASNKKAKPPSNGDSGEGGPLIVAEGKRALIVPAQQPPVTVAVANHVANGDHNRKESDADGEERDPELNGAAES